MKLVKHFKIGDDTDVFLYDDRTIEISQEDDAGREDIIDMTFDELYEIYVKTKFEDTGE